MAAGKTLIACTKCQHEYVVEDKFLGKLLACPKCQGKFYSQASNRNLKDIKNAIKPSASATARMKDSIQSRKGGKSKKKLLIALVAVPVALIIAFALWKSLSFLHDSSKEKPNSELAFNASQDFLKSKSGIASINDAIFSKNYTVETKDHQKRIFTVRISVTMLMPDQKKPSENKISVNMRYLGDEQWEYIDYSFDK
ncbi:MAG TPA: hypothetical protein DET40_21525 [Lentisphaeria bacterium]|nr:MAG: hypothetical protein A2X45_03435 [Lentisphaerae bacterium GWF2_50_93]HCE46133.1 hypothetical protein [Lentisphaeria bacterium]